MNEYVNDFNTTVKTYYKELKNCNPISREREKMLISKAKKNNLKARNEILSSNLKFVFNIAKRYKGYGASLDDLISEGNLGLTKAIDKFDESRDVKFISYAVWWVRQSIQEYLKKKQIRDDREVSDEMSSIVYDNAVRDDEEDEIITKIEVVLSNEDEEETKEIENNQLKVVSKLLDKLDERERKIIEYYFGLNNNDEMTLEEIGNILKISKERVRQIKEKSFKKLRSELLLIDDLNYLFK